MVRKMKNVLDLLNVKMQYLLIIFHVHLFHHIVLQMELIVFPYQNVKHIKNQVVIKVLIKMVMVIVCIIMHH